MARRPLCTSPRTWSSWHLTVSGFKVNVLGLYEGYIGVILWFYYGDNGNYYLGFIGFRAHMGITEKNMDTTIMGCIGCRVVFGLRGRDEQAHLEHAHMRIQIQRCIARTFSTTME